jgi:gas vesicle protein
MSSSADFETGIRSRASGPGDNSIARRRGRMSDDRMGDPAGYLGWFLLGALAGAAAALLLAPKTGRETREILAERSGDIMKRAQQKAGETQARAGDLFDKGREYFEEQTQRLTSAFEAGKAAMREEINRARGAD